MITVKRLLAQQINLIFYSVAFFLPFFISGPQWLTGTAVNCLLFLAAWRLHRRQIFLLIMLPSIGALANGILFGPQTVLLYYFLPFIWLGNYLLVTVFSGLKNRNFVMRVTVSAAAKYLLLVIFAQIYFQLKIVPQLFVTSMGIIQLATALSGGVLAGLIIKFLNPENE